MNINLTAMKTAAVNGGTKVYMKLRKISPELALAGGIACGVGALVVGYLVSKDAHEIIEDTQQELDDIQAATEEVSDDGTKVLVDTKARKQQTWKCYNKMVWKLAKKLAPVLGLEIASIALILLSHGILNKRYLNTTAAYAALNEAFRGYRGRVKEVIGDEAENVLMSGGKVEKNIQVEGEDGCPEKLTGSKIVIQDHKNSPYEFDFNRHTARLTWAADPSYNEAFLRNQQNYFNDLLQARGHVFMNEVLDALGLQRTPAGQICGWVKGAGDDYIDFGYQEAFLRDWHTDSDLCKKNIHLNFNVDGPMWDMI